MLELGKRTEYATGAVPISASVSGWRIALVKIGIIIALPAFVMGADIGFSRGLPNAAVIFLASAAILVLLAMSTGTVAAHSRLSAALIIRIAFGRTGGRFVSGILALALLGWFAVTAQIFGESVADVGRSLGIRADPLYFVLGGGLLMVGTTIYGFNALQRLSIVAVPMVALVLVFMAVLSLRHSSLAHLMASPPESADLGVGISAIVGGMVVGVTIFPDITRFARDGRQARIAALLSFGAMPIVLSLAAIAGIATGSRNLVRIMEGLGLGTPALIFLIIKAWMTNAGNLYSSSLGIAAALGSGRHAVVVAMAGAVGVAMAALGVGTHLVPLMLPFGIAIPPIASIYVTDFALSGTRRYCAEAIESCSRFSIPAFIAWGGAVTFAGATAIGWLRLTGVPAIDAMVVACLIHMLAVSLTRRLGTSGDAPNQA
jgi:cytosine permease